METNVRNLEPKPLWNHFEDLNAVPRPSKGEQRVIAFMRAFGENLGLPVHVDAVGNVIIRKPATAGYENRTTVILQSHLDMVHQKNADTLFDFDHSGIRSYIDGDWVKAHGTTLGADNGIGVAAIMTLLSSTDIPHPPLEALFTIDEETGMTGAFNLEKGRLAGRILLNLDTEDDDEFSIGCAGGIDTNTRKQFETTALSGSELAAFRVRVSGLKGGHSGVDIDLERGNANKIMNRLLYNCRQFGLRIAELDGGSLRNAIPRESQAWLCTSATGFQESLRAEAARICSEFSIEDPGLRIEVEAADMPASALSAADSTMVLTCLQAVHNGVYTMSRAIDGLVETSSSLARVILKEGLFITQSLQRSSVDSAKMDVAQTVAAPFALIGCEVEHTGSYPGWAPNPHSPVKDLMVALYQEMFGQTPKVMAIHAGLECGIIGERYPGLDMISFGPTIKHPHSPDEKVHIPSVQKFWSFLLEILKRIPVA